MTQTGKQAEGETQRERKKGREGERGGRGETQITTHNIREQNRTEKAEERL